MGRLSTLLLLLLLIAVPAAAPVAASITLRLDVSVTSSSPYIAADGQDSATITVRVLDNSTQDGVNNANVLLDVTSPWSLEAVTGRTDNNGNFTTRFLPTTLSGNATVHANVTADKAPDPGRGSYTQTIVAADPQKAVSLYVASASVGSLTEITVLVTDRYGNPVTNLKKKHAVIFNTSLTGDTGFLVTASSGTDTGALSTNGKIKGIPVPVNGSGYAEVGFLLSTKVGSNYITITPPSPLPQTLINIQGVPNGEPAVITQLVTPSGNPPTLATGTGKFAIDYRLYDQWGNPSVNQEVAISVNTGETMVLTTNAYGNVSISYGPRDNAGLFTITATSVKKPSITVSQTLQFVSGVAASMILTASPQSMGSPEVKPGSSALVLVKVIDNKGNPAPGQTVSFSILDWTLKNGAVQIVEPTIAGDKKNKPAKKGESPATAVTNDAGYAIATFTPGTFVPKGEPGFFPMAEGTARVQATWNSKSSSIDLTYKNYPYLSISTTVNPSTVETYHPVEISIRVKGDGYALEPPPLDVIMVTDRSYSMLKEYPDRMVQVMNAAKVFSDQFDYTRDRLGQYSFASNGTAWANGTAADWYEDCGKDGDQSDDKTYARDNYAGNGRKYDDFATLDLPLSQSKSDINKAINEIVPSPGTPMRLALYRAITYLKSNGNSASQKAIVLLTDGDFNWYGDPLARTGSSCTYIWSHDSLGWHQRCSKESEVDRRNPNYYYSFPDLTLEEQNMSVYAAKNGIRIFTIAYSSDVTDSLTLATLANATGGKSYKTLAPSQLAGFYRDIWGVLKDTAGVNTNLTLNFTTVDLNGVPVPGKSAFKYEHIDGKSTLVTRPNKTSETLDSTADWDAGRINISFGTIKVNEEWVVNLSLNATANGNIKALGSSSKVSFEDVTGKMGSIDLPDTYVTAIPEGVDEGLSYPELHLSNLVVDVANDRSTATLSWDISYKNGTDPQIEEQIDVAPIHSEAYVYMGTRYSTSTDTKGNATLNVLPFPDGEYKVRVTGYVFDAGSSSTTGRMVLMTGPNKPVIIIGSR